MTAMQVADLFFTEDRVIVVLLDEASGLVLRSPSPGATDVMIQVPERTGFPNHAARQARLHRN